MEWRPLNVHASLADAIIIPPTLHFALRHPCPLYMHTRKLGLCTLYLGGSHCVGDVSDRSTRSHVTRVAKSPDKWSSGTLNNLGFKNPGVVF